MKRKRVAGIFLLIAYFFYSANGQDLKHHAFKILNAANGLPQSFIASMVQDSTGFIWIGTRDGVARYDGRKFKIFRHIPGDSTSLSDNIITNLYLDKGDRLWIFYEAGAIDVLNTQTEALFHLTKDPVYKSLHAAVTIGQSFAEDGKGNVWLLSANGIFICDLTSHALQFYSLEHFNLSASRIAAMQFEENNITLVTDKSLVIINSKLEVSKVVPFAFSDPFIKNLDSTWKTTPAIARKNGDLVIIDERRVIIYHPHTGTFSIIPLPEHLEPLNFCIASDDKGQIFFDYAYSLYALTTDNRLTLWKPKEENPAYGFKSMLVDRSGVLWLGGNGSGIQLYDLRLSRLSGMPYARNFHEDVLQKFLQVSESEIKKTHLYGMQSYFLRWAKGTDGGMWLARAGVQVHQQPEVYFYKDGHLSSPPWHYPDTLGDQHVQINSLAVSPAGKLWGIDFNLRPVYFDTLTWSAAVFPSLDSVNVNYTFTISSLLIDRDEKFWISTALNGLFCYNKNKQQTVHYTAKETTGSLPTNQLMNIIQDPADNGTLWIGSLSGGLIKFNKSSGLCRVYTTKDGLPNNTVYAIVIDRKGILWCSSNKGIFSFNRESGAVRNFTSKDGLAGDEFNRYHFLQLPNGWIAFGGVDGYSVFNPLTVGDDNYQPAVALTGISINNVSSDFGYPASPFKASINSLDTITLPYSQNFLTFDFAALEYNITDKLQYRYMLEGIDNKWINAGNDNTATYTQVTPGDYTLKINATNTAGEWSSHIKTLVLIIEPPFWKTWWFISLEILAILGTIYVLVQFRIAKVRKEERQKVQFEKEASELKAQALRAQMNPHFVFNCLNSIKALIQEDNKQQAVIYLTTFSKLIRNQLDNAQREISLHEELETCKLYTQLEALRFGSKIICEFEIEKGLDTHSIQVPPLILQPFIENSIWHGILPKNGGKVTISVKAYEEYIECSIDDDGIGREASMHNKSQASVTHQSKGIKLVQGRLNLHNIINNHGGTIELTDKKDSHGKSSGTQVLVKFKREA